MSRTPLLRWYAREGRDLPWRNLPAGKAGTKDPYRILVSEIMLQQTQVSRVLEFYKTWLRRFPTWRSLARASNKDVIEAWAGLGYNRRALALRDIARQVVEHGVPKTEAAWLKLRGIGPYTAAAVASFSQGEKTLPIDTNIRRVLGRVVLGKTFPTFSDDSRIRRSVGAHDHAPLRANHFQALFDLAVAVCTKSPACSACPLRTQCKAAPKFLSGRVRIPKRSIKKANETKHRDKPFPDRIYRGRILTELQTKESVLLSKIGSRIDPAYHPKRDVDWVRNMIERMTKDGLLRVTGSRARLS